MKGQKNFRGKSNKVRRKQNARAVFANTVRTTIDLAKPGFVNFSVRTLTEGLPRVGKLLSIGVQVIPFERSLDTVGANYTSPAFGQLALIGEKWSSDIGSSPVVPFAAQKPPRVLSRVNPTNLKLTPMGPFQRQPVNLDSDKLGLQVDIHSFDETDSTVQSTKFAVIITSKFELLPQADFSAGVVPVNNLP